MENEKKLMYVDSQSHENNISPATLRNKGWQVYTVPHIENAISILQDQSLHVGLIHLELHSQDWNGYWHELHHIQPNAQWVALLSSSSVLNGPLLEGIFNFFYDYHTLPVDLDRLLATLGHAYGMAMIGERMTCQIENDLNQGKIIAHSPVMQAVQRTIGRFARADAPVLITGESGTGKELAALLIHQKSRRARRPFVAINCGALPATLIQAELFGYERGAFTGAHQRKPGRIETAQGGILFLDEISDLPFELQVNLLRVLQEGYIEHLGGNQRIEVDVRIIAATNRNLAQAVAEGRFREDLYYRLNVLPLEMPPLKERGDNDIELLAWNCFRKFANEMDYAITGFSSEALEVMKRHDWPGNVRELINCIRRAMVMCNTRLIKARDLGLDRREGAPRRMVTLDEARAAAERDVIKGSLRIASHNLSRAARLLGISRGTLYHLIAKYGISARASDTT